jgi:hypothetical protein
LDAFDQVADDQPQESISFDQSGSTAEYLRATRPDITLNIEDVQAGLYGSSSSSSVSTEQPAAEDHEVQSTILPQAFQMVELHSFRVLMFEAPPVSAIPMQFPFRFDASLFRTQNNGPSVAEINPLAIVPAQPPSYHVVLIRVLAHCISVVPPPPQTADISSKALMIDLGSSDFVPAKKCLAPLLDAASDETPFTISLPKTVSKKNPRKVLVTEASRRSPKINNTIGFKHVQLGKTPRKKRKLLPPFVPSLDAPPSHLVKSLLLFLSKFYKTGPSNVVFPLVRSHLKLS